MNSMNATPLDGAFCFPCCLLCFSIFDELIAEKRINGSEKSGNYKQRLSYLVRELFPKKENY